MSRAKRLSALRRPSGERKWIRERGKEGTEGEDDTAWYHRYTVEWAVGEVIR